MNLRLKILIHIGIVHSILLQIPWQFSQHSAWADENFDPGDCSPSVRMDEPGGTMFKAPIVDQGPTSNCFAVTEAVQARAIQVAEGNPHPIQPSSIAIATEVGIAQGYNALKNGGDPCDAFAAIKKSGICSVTAMEEHPSGAVLPLGEKMSEEALIANLSHDSEISLLASRSCNPSTVSVVREIPPSDIMEKLNQQTCDLHPLAEVMKKNCANPALRSNPFKGHSFQCTHYPKVTAHSPPTTPSMYVKKLNQLIRGPKPLLPIVLGFCSTFLTQVLKGSTNKADDPSCGPHAIVAIGHRMHAGRCQILLRNSWGPGCDEYTPEIQAGCEPGTGNIYIDAETLGKHMLTIVPPPDLKAPPDAAPKAPSIVSPSQPIPSAA
jgi:hypothetical protein